jgi:hypothetical protein
MTQQIINIGAAPNDGEGDNLRTAFDKVNDNFSNVWAQGPVDSNVRIQGNTISTLQVNQDLALSPNGTGNIRLNNNTIPGANNTWFLGSTTNRWRGLYVGNITANNLSVSGIVDLSGDVTVGGNLTVVGNTIQIGNITTDTKTIQLANTATTDSAANGAGVTVGANDDIATLLYESGNNVWTTNIGLQVGGPVTGTSLAVSSATVYGNIAAINGNFTGNVAANYFIGNGSQLTGMYGNANVSNFLANGFGSNSISTTGNITGNYFFGNGSQLTGIGATISNTAPTMSAGGIWWNSVDGRAYVKYGNIFIDLSPSLVPDPTTYVGNVSFDDITVTNVGNVIPAGNNAYSLGSAAFQWKDLWVSNNTIYINSVPITLSADNVLTVDGNVVLSNDSDTSITTTGNITADYFFGNGSQLTGISGGGNSLVNGDNSFVLDADGNVVFEGAGPGDGVNRGMVWDYGAVANGVNSMVRQDNNGITVRAWTENSGNYAAPVNIVTNQDANAKTWVFDGNGNLTLAGSIQSVNTGFPFSGTITNIESFAYPTPPVITIAEEVFEGPITGQVTISNLTPLTGTPQANGTWYYEAVDPNQFTLYTDAELTEPVNTSSWTAYEGGGGDAVSIGGYTDLTIQGGNVTVGSNNNTWIFGTDGNLTIPGDIKSITDASIIVGNNTPIPNVAIIAVDYEAPFWRLFVNSDTYPNLGIDIKVGDTVTPSWGTQVTATIQQVIEDAPSSYWVFIVDQNVLTGYPEVGSPATFTPVPATWTFGTDGNLNLPLGGVVSEGASPTGLGNTVAITPSGGSDADQQLLIYPTGGEGNHLHLTTGNLYNTMMYVGNDDYYVRLNITGSIDLKANDNNGNTAQWTFGTNESLTLPGGSRLRPLGANLDIFAGAGSYVNLITSDESTSVGVDGGGGYITTAGGTWDFDDTGNLTVPGNIIMTTGIVGSGASPAPYLSGFSSVSAIAVTATGNVTGGNVVTTGTGGNITMTGGNILGVNVVTANSFVGNGATLSNVATQVTGSWTVPVGNSTQSFTVTPNETYYLWVDCNIPNGILAWNATATVTNTNVPVVGAQYAWVYTGGGTPIDFTSIPNQFTGTANTIVRSSVAPSSTTNRFDFGINNTSGNSVVVNYGYTKIS